jgi:ATP-dependent HslUV protease ATP-binding subunit HslU
MEWRNDEHWRGMFANPGGSRQDAQAQDLEAMKPLVEEEALLLNEDESRPGRGQRRTERHASSSTEIDKVASRSDVGGGVPRQGVQRDLLPLAGRARRSTISTEWSRPPHPFSRTGVPPRQAQRPIPELQGRFPIRVELGRLST